MIVYLAKTILCSGLLLASYFALLRKVNTYRFNRFYLLFSVVFSFLVPLISLEAKKDLLSFAEPVLIIGNPTQPETISVPREMTPANRSVPSANLILLVYGTVCFLLFLRFVRNAVSLAGQTRLHSTKPYRGATLVLVPDATAPYSFLNRIFVNRQAYENGQIEPEILHHELTHVRQRHSADILFVELLLTVAWFNPFLFLFRNAIRLNHEFLADEAVLVHTDTSSYQRLLLDTLTRQAAKPFSSSFHFSTTRKRFLMMSKHTSPLMATIRKAVVLPLVIALVFLFSTKLIAQVQPDSPAGRNYKPEQHYTLDTAKRYAWIGESIGYSSQPASPETLQEYKSYIEKYADTSDKYWGGFKNVAPADKQRMEELFRQMSLQQQRLQPVIFLKPSKPLPKITPTAGQFERFKDKKLYGVWIDNKRVSNETLNHYKPADFSHYFISKLYGAAKAGRSYTHQLDLMTNAFYEADYNNYLKSKDQPRLVRAIALKIPQQTKEK